MNKKKIIVCIVIVAVLAAVIASAVVILNKKTYTVSFYSDEQKVIKIETVKRGCAASPPNDPVLTNGKVFEKWNCDFSKVKKNLDVYPEYEEYEGKENVIAMAGAYGKTGEFVFIPLKLCGNVCLSGLDLTVEYDATALEFDSVYNEDGALVYNGDEKGRVKLNYISAENTVDEVDLCGLKFKVKAESGNALVKGTVEKIVAWDDADKLTEPEYRLINSTVFVIG